MKRTETNPYTYSPTQLRAATPSMPYRNSDNAVAVVRGAGLNRFTCEPECAQQLSDDYEACSREIVVLNPERMGPQSFPDFHETRGPHAHFHGAYEQRTNSPSISTSERVQILDQVSTLVKDFRKENLLVQVLELIKEFPAKKYESSGELKRQLEKKYGLDFLINIFSNKHLSVLLVSEGNVYFRVWGRMCTDKSIKNKKLDATYIDYCFSRFTDAFLNLVQVGCEINLSIQKKIIEINWTNFGLSLHLLAGKLLTLGTSDKKVNQEIKSLLQTVFTLLEKT